MKQQNQPDLFSSLATPFRVPVAKPMLPKAQALMPYLEKLDESRTYSNLGPVSQRLKQRLDRLFGLTHGGCALTASGSAALIGAILATAGRADKKRVALCPSYTFVATVSAVQNCGYDPHLVDVCANKWTLDPKALINHARLGEVGLIVVTAPYGRLPDLAAWSAFSTDTGIPVVIDAAASFDVLLRNRKPLPKAVPVVLSFHATKAFGCGEGGAIVCAAPDMLLRAVRAINNGFLGNRNVIGDNINGKMSEYHACVAMAALDEWGPKLAQFKFTASAYVQAAKSWGMKPLPMIGGPTSFAYGLARLPTDAHAQELREQLHGAGIDSRFWYGYGLHAETDFGPFACDKMPITNTLSRRLLGLPFFGDLPAEAMHDICQIMARVLAVSPATPLQSGAQL